MLDKQFWQGKTVFITGHTGFKGGWLSLWLQTLGARVVGYSLPPNTSPNLFSLAGVAAGMVSHMGDVNDFDLLAKTLAEYKPDIVIHMAAQSLVRASYQDPMLTYTTNVMGTVHVLEAVRRVGSVKALINVTTDKCYENTPSKFGFQETDRLGGFDPYSSSKACAEIVTSAYRRSYFTNDYSIGIATVRAGNVIGGGDWAETRLVPDVITSCITNLPMTIRYPNAIRPWQHVLEPLSGYLMLAEKLYADPENFSEAWNFGPDMADAKTVRWVVDAIYKLWGSSVTLVASNAESQWHETEDLRLNCQKAKTELQWSPHFAIEQALQATVSWYKAHQHNQDMRDLTLKQIEDFNTRIVMPAQASV
jgi:CDP-glucose 4,6-dehydratase